jgi:hypothetical protein
MHLHARTVVQPPNESTSHLGYDIGTVTVYLSHIREITKPRKAHLRLLNNVPLSDIQPPHHVERNHLEEVSFSIQISSIRDSVHRSKTITKHLISKSTEVPQNRSTPDYRGGAGRRFETSCRDDAALINWDLQHLETYRSDTVKRMSASAEKLTVFTEVSCDAQPSRKSTPHLYGEFVRGVTDSFDAALRLAICRKPIKPAVRIKVVTDEFRGRLADFAPALFSPGYLHVRTLDTRCSSWNRLNPHSSLFPSGLLLCPRLLGHWRQDLQLKLRQACCDPS